ncbi:MAG: hypothetical protein M1834_007909 [Cirrosporium novae-zelandiae]|nr:MAG: hypothetical protein M1834_007909 [Cirrosporium novae-zelandiae]
MTSTLTTVDSTYPLSTGHRIPIIGFGTAGETAAHFKVPRTLLIPAISHALEVGYRHIDSAVGYDSERPSSIAIRASNIPREDIFFTTKCMPRGYEAARKHVEESLRATGFSYIDLYLVHCPYGGREMRLRTWDALVEAQRRSQVRSLGVSNYGVGHLEELWEYIVSREKREGKGAAGGISVAQYELHPWLARPDIVGWCREHGVAVEAYSPLIKGKRMDEPILQALARKYGKSTAQILLRWSLQMRFVPLPKSSTPRRIEENVDVFDFELDGEDMKVLDTGKYEPCTWDPTVSKD